MLVSRNTLYTGKMVSAYCEIGKRKNQIDDKVPGNNDEKKDDPSKGDKPMIKAKGGKEGHPFAFHIKTPVTVKQPLGVYNLGAKSYFGRFLLVAEKFVS